MTVYETNCSHKWDLNVTPVANVNDSIGSINMTESGCASTATGCNNYYRYDFNGSTSYLEDSTTYLGITSGSWTIEALIKIDTSQSGSGCVISRQSKYGALFFGWNFYYDATANTLVFSSSSVSSVSITSTKTDWANGSTYHVFVTYDGTTYKFWWVNTSNGTATQIGSTTSSTYPYETTYSNPYLEIGRRKGLSNNDTYYKGGIYVIRSFTEVLSTQHMQDNYNAEYGRYNINNISVTLTAPTATTTTTAPTFAQATTLTAPTAATTTTTAPAQTLATTLTKPTGTTTTNAPALDVAPSIITPTGTTATNAPVIARVSQVTLTAPTATTATGVPTFAQATTLTAPTGTTTTQAPSRDIATILITPTATTTTFAISQADLATILSAPTAITVTYAPIASGASSITLTAPTATTATGAPSQNIATTLLTTPTAVTATDAPYQAIEIILITPTATSITTGTLIITQWGAIEVLRATYDQNPISLEGMLKNTDMLTAVNKVTTELLSATCNLETPSLTAVSKNSGRLTAISEAIL